MFFRDSALNNENLYIYRRDGCENSQLLAFDRELVKLDEYYESQEELFNKIAAWLQGKGLVHENYSEALKKRELNFQRGCTPSFMM